tara:strand:- start:708 stop:2324 length:1617 start_codon:yes stop_codon:yes gene_type:complete
MSVGRMRSDFLPQLTVDVVTTALKTSSWCFRGILCFASGFLYAVDLEGLSVPMAETLRAANDKVETDLETLVSPQSRSEARGDLGMLYHAQFLLDAADIEYTKAIEEASLPRWRYLRGIVRMDQGSVLGAIDDFTAVVQQEPNNHLALYRLGVALAVTGDHLQARVALLRAELRMPKSPAVLAALADVAIAAKNWELAQEYLERSWAVEESGQVAYKLGLVWGRLGDLEASKKWIGRRSPVAPTIEDALLLDVADRSISPRFFVKAAKWAWERGDVDEALQAYRFASNLAPKDVIIGLGLAGMLESLGRLVEAIEEVRRIVRANPDDGAVWRRLAALLHSTNVSAALDAAKMAQTIDNDDPSRALLAALAMKARLYELAGSVYEELTTRDAENAYYFYWLAMARLADRNCEGSLKSIAEAIRLQTSWGEAHVVQIRARALCGGPSERVKARSKALVLLRQRPDADMRLTLAITEMGVGNVDEALMLIDAERPHPDASMLSAALQRNMLPTAPFAADSQWWEPEEIRKSLTQNAVQRGG